MATYLDTVMALGPAGFWRLDETSGTVMSDSSGNGHDGTFFDDCVFGRPSPIESDAGSFAISGRVGQVTALDGGNLDVRNGLTIGGWILYRNDFFASTATLLCRQAQWGVLGGFTDLVWPETPIHNTYYFVVGVRNGAIARLYINAVLGWEEDVNVSDEYPRHIIGINNNHFQYSLRQPNDADAPWLVGVSGSGNVWAAAGVDEPFVFDYPLSEAQILEIYQSALNSLFMHAYSNVLPSTIWYTGQDATSVHFPFRHNFEDNLLEKISFLNNNSKTLGGSVEGSEIRPKPRREIEINHLLRTNSERRKFRAKLWANQNRTWYVPIRQDFEQLASSLSSGVQAIPVSTQYKDYEVNSWVGIRQIDDTGKIIKLEVLQIDAVNPFNVHTLTPTVNSYDPFSSYAYPVRRGIISRTQDVKGHTDAVEEVIITFELLAQDEKEIPNRITPWTPTILHKGYEVLDPAIWSHNWNDGREYEVERALSRVDFETGIFEIESDTPGAEEAFEYRMILKGRDKISQFLGWFYARGGSLSYLWVPTLQSDFTVQSSTSSTITVEDTNYSENFALAEARRDIAFVYQDGTLALRRILGFSGSPNETLDLGVGGMPTLSNLKMLSLLKFCQMESDSVQLAWVTDDLVQVAWRFKELLSTPA